MFGESTLLKLNPETPSFTDPCKISSKTTLSRLGVPVPPQIDGIKNYFQDPWESKQFDLGREWKVS